MVVPGAVIVVVEVPVATDVRDPPAITIKVIAMVANTHAVVVRGCAQEHVPVLAQ